MTTRELQHLTGARYLLVSRVGRKSLHANWLLGTEERTFDLYLSCYDQNVSEIVRDGVMFERRPGRKVEGYDQFLSERKAIWERYDFICLMDEDIDTDVATLNRMFEICCEYNLKIGQPALTLDSYFTYAGLLQQKLWTLRFVNFIEMMCPVFRRDALQAVQPLYAMGYESGIDLIWCNLLTENEREFGVIDCASVRHTEPVGSNKSANGFANGRLYEDDIYSILDKFRLPWLSCVPTSAIDRSGRMVEAKVSILAGLVSILPAVFLKENWSNRARLIADHVRHCLFAKRGNIRVEMLSESSDKPLHQC